MFYSLHSYGSLPHVPGVYQFLDTNEHVLYVGKAKDLKDRVSSYFIDKSTLFGKTKILVEQVKKIQITRVESEIEALLLEASLIKKFNPPYNIRLTDGKAYPLIRVVKQNQFSAVLTARRMEDQHSVYFGPFPSANTVRMVLKTIRRIFPYQSAMNHPKRICLYHHLGLCPCVPYFARQSSTLLRVEPLLGLNPIKEYEKTIKHIVDFLDGKTAKVVGELEKERDTLSEKEEFEKAAQIQKQLDAIVYITQPVTQPFDYETNPNLREDVRQKELLALQTILQDHGVYVGFLKRIECYDNSNIQGTNPTSSMVVLTNGEIDKSHYRKFKVKSVKGPNDYATMQEVLTRRLKHTEWPYPDLLIVDGGKGQVSAARKILDNRYNDISEKKVKDENSQISNIKYPVSNITLIGLAKREETIITSDLQEIHIPKSSPALQLVMRIRDEAHRFAITYHRSLRSKASFL